MDRLDPLSAAFYHRSAAAAVLQVSASTIQWRRIQQNINSSKIHAMQVVETNLKEQYLCVTVVWCNCQFAWSMTQCSATAATAPGPLHSKTGGFCSAAALIGQL
jgi:hypothetical protein